MNNIKTKAKYTEGQFFLNVKTQCLFRILFADWQGIITKPSTSKVKESTTVVNDWLYDIEYVGTKTVRRYYEGRITEECLVVDNQDLPKAIYG